MPFNQLLVNIRGNKSILLDKMIYTEHEFAKQLKDEPISKYKPEWTNHKIQSYSEKKVEDKEIDKNQKVESTKEVTFDTF